MAAVDELVGMDPHALADGDALVELRKQIHRLEAVEARATAAWDAKQGWAPDGARNAASWLAASCPPSCARLPAEPVEKPPPWL